MSFGIRHDDLRKRNRAMVISAVRRTGQASRTEIAATTGLSHSTISAISSDLIVEGILAETKGGEAERAETRPSPGGDRPSSGSSRPWSSIVLSVQFPVRVGGRLYRPHHRRGAEEALHASICPRTNWSANASPW